MILQYKKENLLGVGVRSTQSFIMVRCMKSIFFFFSSYFHIDTLYFMIMEESSIVMGGESQGFLKLNKIIRYVLRASCKNSQMSFKS